MTSSPRSSFVDSMNWSTLNQTFNTWLVWSGINGNWSMHGCFVSQLYHCRKIWILLYNWFSGEYVCSNNRIFIILSNIYLLEWCIHQTGNQMKKKLYLHGCQIWHLGVTLNNMRSTRFDGHKVLFATPLQTLRIQCS